jgi:pimeloyl-ACP methyl ester carboxylesterase
MNTELLSVPGATLHYEVRGAGPVLLLICGGVYDAAGFAGLAGQLADRYTVVSYDRRGNSRSPLDAPPAPQSIPVHADDAYRLLTAVGVTPAAPASVFGNSSGAIIGLELAARHPEMVRLLVAHEPPIFELLPDREHWRTVIRSVEETFAAQGAGAAGEVLNAGFTSAPPAETPAAAPVDPAERIEGRIPGGAEAPQGEPDPETLAMMSRLGANMEFFIGYEVPPFARYVPDLAALRGAVTRVVPAVGADSVGEPAHRGALAVAEELDAKTAVFPGDHGGFGSEPVAFAAKLAEVLAEP